MSFERQEYHASHFAQPMYSRSEQRAEYPEGLEAALIPELRAQLESPLIKQEFQSLLERLQQQDSLSLAEYQTILRTSHPGNIPAKALPQGVPFSLDELLDWVLEDKAGTEQTLEIFRPQQDYSSWRRAG